MSCYIFVQKQQCNLYISGHNKSIKAFKCIEKSEGTQTMLESLCEYE